MLSRSFSPTTSPNAPAFSGVSGVPSRPAPTANSSEKGSPLAQYMQLAGATMSFARNAEIFGENEPADYVYSVVSGSVRTYKILNDGRRQISGFYLPGDVFGLEFGDDHAFSAEAIADSKVVVVKRGALNALAERDPAIGRDLFAVTGRELRRVQDHLILLVKTARERVVSFLLEMAERAGAEKVVALPMPRQDIADYLGLTIETVSRTLTSLEGSAAIDILTSRRIALLNRTALNRLNG
jgi:CRP/FNR family transcriptional regulator, nitrogen fixation regulation protein